MRRTLRVIVAKMASPKSFHSSHYRVLFPKKTPEHIVTGILSHLTSQLSRNDHVHFKHSKGNPLAFDIIVEEKATPNTLGQICSAIDRGITLVAERPGIVVMLDQMPEDRRYN